MANPDFNDDVNKRRNTPKRHTEKKAGGRGTMTEKNVNWPGVPGKTQSKDRSGGTNRAKVHPRSEGL